MVASTIGSMIIDPPGMPASPDFRSFSSKKTNNNDKSIA
jgi:hypothetical protein